MIKNRRVGKWDRGLDQALVDRINQAEEVEKLDRALTEAFTSKYDPRSLEPKGIDSDIAKRLQVTSSNRTHQSLTGDPIKDAMIAMAPRYTPWEQKGAGLVEEQKAFEKAELKRQKKMEGLWDERIQDQLEEMGSGEVESTQNMTQEKYNQIKSQKIGSNAYQNSKFERGQNA